MEAINCGWCGGKIFHNAGCPDQVKTYEAFVCTTHRPDGFKTLVAARSPKEAENFLMARDGISVSDLRLAFPY